MSDFQKLVQTVALGFAFSVAMVMMDSVHLMAVSIVRIFTTAMAAAVEVILFLPTGDGGLAFNPLFPMVVAAWMVMMIRMAPHIIGTSGPPFPSFADTLSSLAEKEITEADRVKQRADIDAYLDGEITEVELEERLEAAWAEEKGMDDSEEVRITDTPWVRATDDEASSSEDVTVKPSPDSSLDRVLVLDESAEEDDQ